jgi:hypothetical protein
VILHNAPRVRSKWNGRQAVTLSNGIVEMTLLVGGGHIASFSLTANSINSLWEAPWETADPLDPRWSVLANRYGADPAGQFLAGYTGHALCLDIFGMPSAMEAAAGVALHGETGVREWEIDSTPGACTARVTLPIAGLQLQRDVILRESAAFVTEAVTNDRDVSRDIHWVQHATFGPPMLNESSGVIDASVEQCVTWPEGYEGRSLVRANVRFAWPNAPVEIGSHTTTLRQPFAVHGTGFVVAALTSPHRSLQFVIARSTEHALAIGYCFRREDFPWVAIWEENCARKSPPWNSSTKARGMEFGTTPMPLGREGVAELGEIFGTPSSLSLGPHASRQARFCMFLTHVPRDWQQITDVVAHASGLTLRGAAANQQLHVAANSVDKFFNAIQEEI